MLSMMWQAICHLNDVWANDEAHACVWPLYICVATRVVEFPSLSFQQKKVQYYR